MATTPKTRTLRAARDDVKLAINGRFLTQRVTGVQRYALELVRALDGLIEKGDPAVKDLSVSLLTPPKAERVSFSPYSYYAGGTT